MHSENLFAIFYRILWSSHVNILNDYWEESDAILESFTIASIFINDAEELFFPCAQLDIEDLLLCEEWVENLFDILASKWDMFHCSTSVSLLEELFLGDIIEYELNVLCWLEMLLYEDLLYILTNLALELNAAL